ncbi:MAG: hypothetical protein ACK494_03775 [Planctomycetota bacterium]
MHDCEECVEQVAATNLMIASRWDAEAVPIGRQSQPASDSDAVPRPLGLPPELSIAVGDQY